jgi:predicted outer membrane repeat protein
VAAATATVTRWVPCPDPALASALSGAASGATLNLARGCTYVLTAALPAVAQDLTIDGNGATLHRGNTAANGAAIADSAFPATTDTAVHVAGASFIGNTAGRDGGAIYVNTLDRDQITHCRFLGNTAAGSGGAIFTLSIGTAITDSTFRGNSVAMGGALALDDEGAAITGP